MFSSFSAGLELRLLLGLILGAAAGLAAWRAKALSRSGALAAALVGGGIFGLGGWSWALLLLSFFIGSSALSLLLALRQRRFGLHEKFAKGSRRDAGQVLANGGLALILTGLHAAFPTCGWVWIAFCGALAAVNADTWATELGVFSPVPPRLITTLRPVESGTSGGVSALGSLAALAGAGVIAGLAAWLDGTAAVWLPALLGGLVGSAVDSLLGATLQAVYFCPACQKETERHPQHACGTPTQPRRGWRWLNNDWVNFCCALAGAATAVLMHWLLAAGAPG